MPVPSFVCWDARDAREVLGFDAEDLPDEVFLGVHTERDLFLSGAEGQDGALRTGTALTRVGAREFLGMFQATPDAKAVVLGESGAGKSHLIQWLWLNMPRRADTHVLRIPKTGISLRSVVRDIIGILPAERQALYRERLEAAGYDQMDARQRVRALTAMIALSIAADDPAAHGDKTVDQLEEEQDLCRRLPTLFNDPHLQETHFGVAGGVIERLVEHVFETARHYVAVEGRRAFVASDLPLEGVDIARTAGPTRAILADLVAYRDLIPTAVDIINRNLNAAIARVLNFTGDQLIDLMTEVRECLHERGQTLVLLIEDFARLQGLDVPLAQALTVPARQGTRRLCEMRWAMAVTRGYYEQSRASLKTRMNFVIDMDVPSDEGGGAAAFAARYLNAARVGTAELRRWRDENLGEGVEQDLPNRCGRCEMREDCHSRFGSVDEIGLYPFTSRALANMVGRADPNHAERFNPRKLLMSVLTPVFVDYREELREGRFPPSALLQRLGAGRLSPIDQQEIARRDPADAERQRTLLELWDGERLSGLDPGIFAAFGLKDLSDIRSGTGGDDGTGDVGTVPPGGERSPPNRDLMALRAWANGGVLSQDVAQSLRVLVYDALEEYIDWDAEGLERATFAKRSGTSEVPFRNVNISFARQTTETGRNLPLTAVGLRIPPTDDPRDLRDSALALEGLWQFRRNGNWAFPQGAQFAVGTAEALARWSGHVLSALKRWPRGEVDWNPLEVAVEVLAAGAALAGRPASARATLAETVDALFTPLPENSLAESRTWQGLHAEVRLRQPSLVDIVQSRASGGKGGQAGAYVDPGAILPVLERLRAGWRLQAAAPTVPANARDPYARLASLHGLLRAGLQAAATEEHDLRIAWLAEVRDNVPDAKRSDLVAAFERLANDVSAGGVAVAPGISRELTAALDEFRTVQFDNAVRAAEAIARADDPLSVLPRLVRDRGGAVEASRRLFAAVRAVLDVAETGVSDQLAVAQAQLGEALPRHQASIEADLSTLTDMLSDISDDPAHQSDAA